jgi:hypothetical protein
MVQSEIDSRSAGRKRDVVADFARQRIAVTAESPRAATRWGPSDPQNTNTAAPEKFRRTATNSDFTGVSWPGA